MTLPSVAHYILIATHSCPAVDGSPLIRPPNLQIVDIKHSFDLAIKGKIPTLKQLKNLGIYLSDTTD
jgi:hypothetical protein